MHRASSRRDRERERMLERTYMLAGPVRRARSQRSVGGAWAVPHTAQRCMSVQLYAIMQYASRVSDVS